MLSKPPKTGPLGPSEQGFDFGDGNIEGVVEPDDLRPTLEHQLELRFSPTAATHDKLGVEVVAHDKADSAIPVRPSHGRPIAAIIGGKARGLT